MTRRNRKRIRAGAVAGLIGLVAVSIACPPVPRLVWNVSASAPTGLYVVSPGAALNRGDMVVAWVPAHARRLAAARRYIPMNVPLVKRIAAGPGARACAAGEAIFIDGHIAVLRRAADAQGRPMPWWTGCRLLRDGEYLLLMEAPGSFDGRYFGVTERSDIVGAARLLWAR